MNKYDEALKSARETNRYDIWHLDRIVSETLDEHLDVLEELLSQYDKLEKALKRACYGLGIAVDCDHCPSSDKKCKTMKDCEDAWKEWLLKDE